MLPFWKQAILAAIGPTAIIVAAFIAWTAQRRIAVRRATFDFISRHEVDNHEWRVAKRQFSEIVSKPDHPEPLIALLMPSDSGQWESRVVVTSLLNHFEAVAVAIKHQAISEVIYKDWQRTNFVQAWKRAESFIIESRKKEGRETAWVNFEGLARKWIREEQN